MGKVNNRRYRSNKMTPYPLPSHCKKFVKDSEKELGEASSQKDYDGATCPVCLEPPHNAVLLLCSSYHKGCRPYMCATSSHFSYCLNQYKKAYTNEKTELPELPCPFCRGQVKGWTIVKDAQKHLNSKKRSCMHGTCKFSGNLQKLRKHVEENHRRGHPNAVDPAVKDRWKRLESERDRRDAISMIMSLTPGAVVFRDYVIEPYNNGDGAGVEDSDVDDEAQGSHIRFTDSEDD